MAEPRSLYDHLMTWAEQEAAGAERTRQEDPQDPQHAEEEATALLDAKYPTGGWLRRWFWRAAEGATRSGAGGGP